MTKTRFLAPVLGLLLFVAGMVVGQPPPRQNINPGRHPNLAAAQDLCKRAFDRIVQAQQANEFDMNGHAQKAKDLLDEASKELGRAAGAANRNGQ
jgi:hypothetical protein